MRAIARARVCGYRWVADGRVKGSAVRRKSAAAATSTSLLESRGLTPCVCCNYGDNYTTSKVLNGDFIFSTYTTRNVSIRSDLKTTRIIYTIDKAVFDVHVRKVVVVFTAVWAANVSAKLSALFLPVLSFIYVCDIGCAKDGYTRKNIIRICIYILYKCVCNILCTQSFLHV